MPQFLGSWEFIVLALLVITLFGAKRLPDSARALGRSMRILKAETKGLRDDDSAERPGIAPAPQAVPTAPSDGVAPPVPQPPATP